MSRICATVQTRIVGNVFTSSGFGFLYPCLICISLIFFLVKSVCCMQNNWPVIVLRLFVVSMFIPIQINQSISHSFKQHEMVFLIGEPYKKLIGGLCSNALSTK